VKGKRPDHLLVGDDTNLETLAYLQNKIESSESFGAEMLNYTKEGQPYWARILGQPIFDGQGKLAGYFALQQDITREKEIEARMKDADKRMRLALEQIGDNVWEHDFEKGETTFSKADNEFVGITNQAGNENATLWWESVHKEDRHLLTENDRLYKSGSIQSHRLEYRMVRKDGSIRWVLDRGVVIENDENGLPLRIVGTHTDISKIKQTEIELQQRVSQFKALAENIPGVIYEYAFHPDGTDGLSYISPAIERIFGIAPDDFKNYLSYVHEEDRATLLEKNKKSRETLEPFYDESRLIIPGKPLRWQSVQSSFSYRTESGSIIFTGFILDITQRKNAENELIKQQQFYENILNNIPADVAVFNHKHQYLFINPVAIGNAELRKWIIGKTDEEYCYKRNRPLSVAHERRAFFNKLLETKKGTAFEERILKPNNEEAYYLRKMYPVVGDDGEISIVIGYGIDITDRKRAEEIVKANEEKYRGIIANMNLGLLEVDNEDRIQYANHSFLQMSHYTEAELYGQSASAILLSEEGRQLIAEKNVLRERGVKDAYELPVIDKNGAQRWWLISGAPRLNDRGEVVGSIGIHLDITNQKKLEAELREAKAMAEESSDAKERFLANMSHEIRTPMNAIMGLSRQLKKTTLDEKQSQYLDSILTASDNLLVIINDILDLSKIAAGKLALEQIGFSIQSQLRQVSSLLMHRAEEKGLWLDVQVDERLAGIHLGDPFRLHQIFINLAGNAIKFTSNGGILLSAKLVQQQGAQQLISFSVADTGVGISDDFKEQLFDAFSQEHNSTQRTYGGSGLGLSISRQLVHLMNGNLQVKSKQGKGSVFSFELWLGMGNESDLPVAKTLVNAQDVLTGKWILLVEDNSMNRLVASTLLHQYGAEVHEAENGAIALMALQHTHYDVVLMDIQMPVLDGIATTRKIREIYGASLPVIALTANALPSERANTLAAGMNDFITKPFEEVEFIETIAKWAGSSTTILEKVAPPAMLSHTGLVKLYNLQKMEEISHGNKAFLLRMVQLFCRQAPEMAAALRQHFEKAEWKQMGAVAHKMKPAIDNMMIDSLKEVIREIEKTGKTAMEVPELPDWIDRVEAVVSKVVASMALEFELTPE
jgi:PAS domain S-box-containing protein